MTMLTWALIIIPIANTYFVWTGFQHWYRDPGHSLILFGWFLVKAVIWLVGLIVGALAIRFVLGVPVFPFGGATFAVLLLLINLLPGTMHLMSSRYGR